MNGYGYKVCYKQHGNEKLKLYLVTNTYDSALWNGRWYQPHAPPDRKTAIPIHTPTGTIHPITTYQEYKRRWRNCPF